MLVMERAGVTDITGVSLRPDTRPEDREAIDRAIALGGVTVLPSRGSRPRRLLVAIRGCGDCWMRSPLFRKHDASDE